MCTYFKPLNPISFDALHKHFYSRKKQFCYCPFCFRDFLLTGSCCLSSKAGRRRCSGLVCQLVMWLLGMGDCLNPVPWAPADQMLNGLGKMIGKCCASLRSHSESLRNPSPSTNIRGPFIFSQTGFSSLTQAAKEGEEWRRESPYQLGKWTSWAQLPLFLSHYSPLFDYRIAHEFLMGQRN